MVEHDRQKTISWVLGTIIAIIALVKAIGAYQEYWDSRHEPAGSVAAVAVESKATALDIVLRMESDNQNLKNHYLEVLDDCEIAKQDPELPDCSRERVQEAKDQIERLGYNRTGIVELKQRVVGLPLPPK